MWKWSFNGDGGGASEKTLFERRLKYLLAMIYELK